MRQQETERERARAGPITGAIRDAALCPEVARRTAAASLPLPQPTPLPGQIAKRRFPFGKFRERESRKAEVFFVSRALKGDRPKLLPQTSSRARAKENPKTNQQTLGQRASERASEGLRDGPRTRRCRRLTTDLGRPRARRWERKRGNALFSQGCAFALRPRPGATRRTRKDA